MTVDQSTFLTVRQFVEEHQGRWPASEAAVRAIILDAAWGKNNFQSAFFRVGRRVLIDPKEFWQCVNRMQGEGKNAIAK